MIYDSPVTGIKKQYTYSELLDEVERFAGVLKDQCQVKMGDRVILYMPMIPENIIAMLACTRLGAPHSVVFGGFAARELAIRIDDAKADVVISASCGVEPNRIVEYEPILKHALEICKTRPNKIVIKHRKPTPLRPNLPQTSKDGWGQMDWDEEMNRAKPIKTPTSVPSTHPSYILYTSGTTGTPKGIVRDTGGYATAMMFCMDWFMKMKPGDVYFAASDLGWVVGHSFILYGPLLAGCSTVLYEGKPVGTPDASAFWRLISEYKINSMFAAPTALRAIRRDDPNLEMINKYDVSSLKSFFWAGERGDPETVSFYQRKLKNVPILDAFWQTETGWPVCGVQDDVKQILPGSTAKPLPGFDVCVLEENEEKPHSQRLLGANEMGMLCIRHPLPPGGLTTVYNNDERYINAYMKAHPGFYSTGDMGFRDADGYVTVMSRNDDLINVAGHRLSTGTMESAISGHPSVAETACVGAKDSLKGEVCVGFIVLNRGVDQAGPTVEKECVARVRDLVGPVASFHHCFVVNALPKTRSGKILRTVLRKILDNDPDWPTKVPGTCEDVSVLYDMEKLVRKRFLAG